MYQQGRLTHSAPFSSKDYLAAEAAKAEAEKRERLQQHNNNSTRHITQTCGIATTPHQ